MKDHNGPTCLSVIGCLLITLLLVAACGPAPTATSLSPASQSLDVTPTPPATTSTTAVKIFLPNGDNLQWMNFWVAQGAGFLAEEGLAVTLVIGGGTQRLLQGEADVAVMPRPMFLSAVEQGQPVLAFANLLQNDPINLVVRPEVAEERGLSADGPLADRLAEMQGLRVGVAPGPPPRLRLLFQTAGLDADSDIEMVIVPGQGQNQAFAEGQVDALYAHTPFLEQALVDQGAVMIVNQSAGRVAGLANRQIHFMATTQDYANANPEVMGAITRAIYRAQQLIHADRQATLEALRASDVELQAPQGLESIVEIYEPAIPQTPAVSSEGVLRELDLFPDNRPLPDLSHVDMTAHVDNQFVEAVTTDNP